MKQFNTALLAGALVLATGMAFAQTGTVSGQSSTKLGTSGAQADTNANARAPALGVNGGATAKMKKNNAETTGSGSMNSRSDNTGTAGDTGNITREGH